MLGAILSSSQCLGSSSCGGGASLAASAHSQLLLKCLQALTLVSAAAAAAVAAGKFYTLTTGANEKRWGKMKEKLNTTIKSFSLVNA